jgi:hypothetical protein
MVVPIKTLPVQIWAFCASRDRDLQRPIVRLRPIISSRCRRPVTVIGSVNRIRPLDLLWARAFTETWRSAKPLATGPGVG